MFTSSQKHLRRTGTALALIVTLWGTHVSNSVAEDRAISFNIPAESTAKALTDFSKQAGIQILFPYDIAANHTAPAISGQFQPGEVLAKLLDGTGLEIVHQTATTITLRGKAAPATKSSAASDPAQIEVVITGTHIRGGNPTSPVHIVTQKDIEQSGYSQIGDLARSLPENFSGGQNPGLIAAYAGNSAQGNDTNASTFNLRGLGPDATLVLLNGHRLAGDYLNQGSDISGIPLGAVQRMEVVADGSSALYGSDAVAGVVNIVLKRNFDGGLISARVGSTAQGGGTENTYSALWGTSSTDGYLLANVELSRQGAIRAGQRDFLSSTPAIGTVLQPQERRSFFVSAGRNFGEGVSLTLDGLVSDRNTQFVQQSSSSAYIAYGQIYVPSYSVNAGLSVRLGGDWGLHGNIGASGSRDAYHEAIPAYSYHYTSGSQNADRSVELTADGTLFALPSGPVKGAFGGGVRQEQFVWGWTGGSTYLDKTREVDFAYGELQVPLVTPSETRVGLHSFDLSASARAEDYSDFGSSTNPRLGFRYVPLNDLSLRGTWGKSFKAPSFWQMYSTTALYLYPASSAGYRGGQPGATLMLESGGNPELKPEKSTSWTLGADYTPAQLKSVKVSATYFNIDYRDRVLTPVSNLAASLSSPLYAPFVDWNPSADQQSTLVSSLPSFTNYSGAAYDPSKVVAILRNTYQNVTAQTSHGVDLSYRQSVHLADSTMDVFANATWTSLKQQSIPTQPLTTISGTIFSTPDFKARGGLNWTVGDVTATGIVNYIDKETDIYATPQAQIGSWTTVDANVTYRLPVRSGPASGISLSLSVTNLFDRDPPHATSPSVYYQGIYFDSANASVVGRFTALTLRKSW